MILKKYPVFPNSLRQQVAGVPDLWAPHPLLRRQQHPGGRLTIHLTDLHQACGYRPAGQDSHWNPQSRGLIPQCRAWRQTIVEGTTKSDRRLVI